MARIALHTVLRAGRETDYEIAHRVVPDDLLALLHRAGIRDWVIWRSGRDLFHVVDCDDFEGALAIIAADPADERWQAAMTEYVESVAEDPDGAGGVGLRQVWAMGEQDLAAEAPDGGT